MTTPQTININQLSDISQQQKSQSLELAMTIPGAKVVIHHNPHDFSAHEVLGVITGVRKGEGFAGTDLVDVQYTHPVSDTEHNFPFSLDLLELACSDAEFKFTVFGQAMAILKGMQKATRESAEIAALGVAIGVLREKLRP
jgi:hypothetical protein